MARLITEESSYYPPRARWYSRLWMRASLLKRELRLDKIHLPAGFSVLQLILSIVIPGYAFFTNGRRSLGRACIATYGVATALFVVALGYQISAIAFGVMISAHTAGIIFLEGYWLRNGSRFGLRLILAIMTLIVIWRAAYAPAVDFLQAHWLMPVRVEDKVTVVNQSVSPGNIARGETILFTSAQPAIVGVVVRSGLAHGEVLALAGERLRFSTNALFINGVAYPLLARMPTDGEMVVPEKHWFVWPKLAIQNNNANEAAVTAAMLRLALVSEDQLLGKPFRHWFGRQQITP